MNRLFTLAVAALVAAPLFADDPKQPAPATTAPPAQTVQTEPITLGGTAATQDSPLVAAAKKSKKNNAKKKVVITNATLNKDASKSHVTTTKELKPIEMPAPPALPQTDNPPAAEPAQTAAKKPTPEQQKKKAEAAHARAEEEGLFDDPDRLDAAAAKAGQPQPAPPSKP